MSALAERLIAAYPTLDSALVLSIASDFGDDDDHQESEARQILDALALESSNTVTSSVSNIANGTNGAPSLVYSEETASNSGATTSTDEEEAERLFREWSLKEDGNTEDAEGGGDSMSSSMQLEMITDPLNPVGFLKSLFPKRDRLELQVILEDSHGDVEAAIETLLTEDLLMQEEADELLYHDPNGNNGSSPNGKKKHRQRKHKTGKEVISLTSTPRGIRSLLADEQLHSKNPKPDTPNRWVQLDSTVLYLSTLLSLPAGHISSLFHRNGSSLPLAVSTILDEREHLFESLEDGQQVLSELAGLYPDRPIGTLKRCLAATSGDLDKSVDLVNTLQDLYAKEGTPLAHRLLLDAAERQSTKSALVKTPSVPAARTNGQASMSTRLPELPIERPPNAHECAALAQVIRERQDSARRSAARAFQARHTVGHAGVAAYWSEHARQLARQAETWELRAARAVVNERRTNMPTTHRNQVDLHGLTASQALTVTNECLTAWWAAPTASSTFTVITGAGRHSSGQTPILLPAVKKLLEREGYDWKFEDKYSRGSITVIGLQGRRKNPAY